MASGNLRYAVLGLVASKTDGVHGYQLKGECEAIGDEFWRDGTKPPFKDW